MNITFFELEEWEKKYLTAKCPCQLESIEGTLTEDYKGDLSQIDVLSIFIYSKITPKIIKKMPNLKMITTRSTGFDHVDLTACENKIIVSNVPTYGSNTVAEHTFALILALSRKIVESADKTRINDFSGVNLRGFDLSGKTIGIIGTGHIGSHVARIAFGFGMKILAFDGHKNDNLIKSFGVKYLELDELLNQSDIISLHVPENPGTYHLINKEKFAKIKKGAYIINTARGGLIDTHALLEALEDDTIAGAGLDVLEEECHIKEERQILAKEFPKKCLVLNIANNILLRHPNVVVTPHNAFNSVEALQRILDTTVENITAFQNGKPINIVK